MKHEELVYETTDYSIFKLDQKNRPITEDRVRGFIKKFKEGENYLRDFPALVTKGLVVLDGQHRFEATKRLGLPFFYRISNGLTIDKVASVQTNAGWSVKDYIHAYIQQGIQSYVVLSRFIARYGFNPSNAVTVLTGQDIGLTRQGFYLGELTIKDETAAHARAKKIQEVSDVSNIKNDTALIRSLCTLMNKPDYSHKRMIEQMEKYGPSLFRRHVNKENYMRALEQVYNYRIHEGNKVRF